MSFLLLLCIEGGVWIGVRIEIWHKYKCDLNWNFFEPLLLISQPFHLLIFLSSFFSPKLTLLGAWVTHFATLSNNYCLHGIDSKFEIQVVDGNSFQNTQIVCILSFNSIFFMAFNINLIFSPPIFMFLHICKIGDF